MSQTVTNDTELRPLTDKELEAWQLKRAGLTQEQIAKKMKKNRRSVARYLDYAKEFYAVEGKPATDPIAAEIEKLIPKALEALSDSLSPETDTKTRLSAALRVLGSKGYLIEKKEIANTGKVEFVLKDKLQKDTMEGLQRFGYNIPNLSSDN